MDGRVGVSLGVWNDTLILYVSLGGWMGRWVGTYTNGRGSPYCAFTYAFFASLPGLVGWCESGVMLPIT